MLIALLLLGLVPLAFLPGEDGDPGDPPEHSGDDDRDIAETGETELLTADSEPDGETTEDDARDYQPETGAGEYTYDGFRAGTDSVTIDLGGETGDLEVETSTSQEGSTLTINTAQGPMTIRFSGLDSLPADDIHLQVTDPETGETETVTLAEALAEDSTEEAGLDPLDPDDPGDWQGPGNGEPGIDPDDPSDPGEPGPVGDGSAGLDPLGPDGEPTGEPDEGGNPDVGELLAAALQRDSGADAGLDDALARADDPQSTAVASGDGDDSIALPDDGTDGGGAGTLAMFQTTPVLSSDDGVTVVDGGAGDDQLQGGDGAAYLFGGPGDDTVQSGDGTTAAFGGEGDDVLSAERSDTGAYLDGGTGDDVLIGGGGDDVIEGGSHGAAPQGSDDDRIDGGEGNDRLRGGWGADTISGGDGDDTIDHHGRLEARETGGAASFGDHIDGAADTLYGGAGNDTIIMDRSDTAEGGEGEDYFWLYSDSGDASAGVAEITDFSAGTDFLRVSLNPEDGQDQAYTLKVEASEDGQDGMVSVNGELIAILRGAPDASEYDVYVEADAGLFS